MSDQEQKDREYKNAVFAARQAVEGKKSNDFEMSQLDAARKNLGFHVRTTQVPLPSKGLVYPRTSSLYGKEEVEIMDMTPQQEDVLMNRHFIKKGTVITELIKSSLIDKSIDVSSLISGDRNALMVSIRITGYGREYSPNVSCPACEFNQDFPIDLASLELKPLGQDPVEPGTNAFEFKLPISEKTVYYKFLTGKEEEEILATAEIKKKKGLQQENEVTTKLLYSLVAVDGNTDRNYISQFARFMPARDSLALRRHIDKMEPSVDMRMEFTCKSCNHTEVMGLPLGASFFWPNARE